MTVTTVLAL